MKKWDRRYKLLHERTEPAPLADSTLFIGCAIWAYDGWVDNFFPSGTPKDGRLRAYGQRLTAVEINATFYAIPSVPTVQRWAVDTPETFRFCPKFPKTITHAAMLKDTAVQTATFLGVMRLLGKRLGPLMLQLPPAFGPSRLPLLQQYLDALPDDLEIAVEVRHPDWFTEENILKLDKVLSETNAARICFDVRPAHNSTAPEAISAQERKPNVPLVAAATQPFVVVRYISSPIMDENFPYFDEWIPRLTRWCQEQRRVYFFAHCPLETLSPSIAREIYRRVQQYIPIPALPWDAEDNAAAAKPTQLSLF